MTQKPTDFQAWPEAPSSEDVERGRQLWRMQFIRINGTVVGGMVGLAIHTLTTVW